MDMALSDRIQEILDSGFTKAALARAAGVTPAAVTHWCNGDTLEIKGEPAARLQMATNYSAAWIATGKGPKKAQDRTDKQPDGNVSPAPVVRFVPILNKVNAGMYQEIIESPPDDVEQMPVYIPIKTYTFALRVDGDSMEPGFPHGCVVLIDPEREPQPRDFVVAINGDNEATFKQLVKDGGDWYLKPLNQRYPIKPLGTANVIGVAVGLQVFKTPGDDLWPA